MRPGMRGRLYTTGTVNVRTPATNRGLRAPGRVAGVQSPDAAHHSRPRHGIRPSRGQRADGFRARPPGRRSRARRICRRADTRLSVVPAFDVRRDAAAPGRIPAGRLFVRCRRTLADGGSPTCGARTAGRSHGGRNLGVEGHRTAHDPDRSPHGPPDVTWPRSNIPAPSAHS